MKHDRLVPVFNLQEGGTFKVLGEGDLCIFSSKDSRYIPITLPKGSTKRPIYISELFQTLRECNLFFPKLGFLAKQGDKFYRIVDYILSRDISVDENLNLVISRDDLNEESIDHWNIQSDTTDLTESERNEINKVLEGEGNIVGFRHLLKDINDYSFDNLRFLGDIVSKTSHISDLDLRVHVNIEGNTMINLTVSYVKGGKVFVRDITFPGLMENKDYPTLYSVINDDISVEYIQGYINIYPKNNRVTDYKISNCCIELC